MTDGIEISTIKPLLTILGTLNHLPSPFLVLHKHIYIHFVPRRYIFIRNLFRKSEKC